MTESNQKWYVLRAMSGKEKQVKEYIDIELEKGGDLSRYVSQVVIPTERVYVVRNGKKVIKERTFLPGYVLIEAALTREISGWLRNVPNVLGFLGVNESPGNYQPIPLHTQEAGTLVQICRSAASLQYGRRSQAYPYRHQSRTRRRQADYKGDRGRDRCLFVYNVESGNEIQIITPSATDNKKRLLSK